jgi:hypothetical protein
MNVIFISGNLNQKCYRNNLSSLEASEIKIRNSVLELTTEGKLQEVTEFVTSSFKMLVSLSRVSHNKYSDFTDTFFVEGWWIHPQLMQETGFSCILAIKYVYCIHCIHKH